MQCFRTLADKVLKDAEGNPEKALPSFLQALEFDEELRDMLTVVAHAYLCSCARERDRAVRQLAEWRDTIGE